MATAQRGGSSRFSFVGNRLGVDLLNTRVGQGAGAVELLVGQRDLMAWAEAAGVVRGKELAPSLQRGPGRAEPEAFRRFRERLRKELERWRQGRPPAEEFLALLNELLARDAQYAELRLSARAVAVRQRSRAGPLARLYAAVARSAAEMLVRDDPRRFRKCADPACSLMFYDVSKAGRRRWHSMRPCGIRAKVRAYYWRHRR